MPALSRPFRSRRSQPHTRRLLLEPLEDRSLLAPIGCSTIVTNTNDSGPGSLRDALNCSNTNPGKDTVSFNIPGSGVHTIAPAFELPWLTDPVVIDGYTQPGASPNTNGPSQGSNAVLNIEFVGLGLLLNASDSTIRGLVINRVVTGIYILDGNNNRIEGNFLGTDPTGAIARPAPGTDGVGIEILSTGAASAVGNIIGGASPAARNLISGNRNDGIVLVASKSVNDTVIQGNLIGTDITGTRALPNSIGIGMSPKVFDTVIGGSAPGEGNVISGNLFDGLALGADQDTCGGGNLVSGLSSGNVIRGNKIGADVTGTNPLGNGTTGILVGFDDPASTTTIGGVGVGDANIIAFNGANGIGLMGNGLLDSVTHTTILANSIFSNVKMGISFYAACTPTPNDPGDADTGPNNLQNYPQLTAATPGTAGTLTLNYSVTSSTANSVYPLRIEFFKADITGKQGQTFLGFDTYTAAQAQTPKSFTFTPSTSVGLAERIVATATDSAGNTSEFSGPIFVQGTVCSTIVTNTNDTGPGSLSDAITCANNTPGKDTVAFNIPGTGVQTIGGLTITDPVVIDGYTQPGASFNTNGPGQGDNAVIKIQLFGVVIDADNSVVRGLSIRGVSAGIAILPGRSNNVIEGNFIGVDPSGATPGTPNATGIRIDDGATNNTIGGTTFAARNVISANFASGITIFGSGNTVAGNIIGLDPSGTVPLGYNNGVLIQGNDNLIGGTTPSARNVISGNSANGITILGQTQSGPAVLGTKIQGNFIGTDVTGTIGLKSNLHNAGIAFTNHVVNTLIGGTAAGAGNLISGNFFGIQPLAANAAGVVIQGNYVGTDVTGMLAISMNEAIDMPGSGLVGGPGTGIGVLGRDAFAGNLISGNIGDGLIVRGTVNVQGNVIGLTRAGTPLGNFRGILVTGSGAHIGGTEPGNGNVIANSTADGISISSGGPIFNSILGNSIFNNGDLGIDLGNNGATANDPGDADTGANNLQNFPQLTSATVASGASLTLNYSVPSSTANSAYPLRIEFFKADSTGKQGQTFLGFDTYTAAEAQSPKTVSLTPAVNVSLGERIIATATDSAGNTSEFSAQIFVQGPTCSTIVTNTDDSGTGSLRDAIQCANITPGTDTIAFNIPGTGVQTISPLSPLPEITDAVVVDGYTQPGASPNTNAIDDPDASKRGLNGTLLIQVSGDASSTAMNGLRITGDGTVVRGLVINDFQESGIKITGKNNIISGNYIGTEATGMTVVRNGTWGVQVTLGATGNVVGTDGDAVNDAAERNLISGNLGGGVDVSGSGTSFNTVAGNLIGTNRMGTAALGNLNRGVDVRSGAQQNRVGTNADGVSDGAERNIISANGWEGVAFYDTDTSYNVIAGNFVGTDITGAAALPNLRSGIAVWGGATLNTVGGTSAAARNVFSGNTLDGIEISSAGTANNTVQGNLCGTDSSGTLKLGNLRDGIRVWHGAVNTMIGGTVPGSANAVAFNAISGVSVLSSDAVRNAILGNSIYQNGDLGIDIGEDGLSPNDPGDADSGTNNSQNFPDISHATKSGGLLKVTYTVPSDPANSTYPIRIEFFQADADGQEGQTFLGADTFTADDFAAGGKTITFTTASPIKVFDKIVATATDSLPTGEPANTSEFSSAAVTASPWRNPRNRLDVNDDTHIAANDVVAVVNYINAFKSGPVPDDADNSQPFLDPNGDNNVAPNDALEVINAINAGQGGEGESQEPVATSQAPVGGDLLALLAYDLFTQSQRKR